MLHTAVHNTGDPTSPSIKLIYAGGTFGSYGKPLSALSADIIIPLLLQSIHNHIALNVSMLENTLVKDSSQLTPSDFVHFYQLILNSYGHGHRQFVLITGTDTLSYLGAFLAEAFAGSDICIILTASMRPLFDSDIIDDYIINENSDAWGNLSKSIGLASHGESGTYITIGGESWPAQTVQKIHSHDLLAFTGHQRAGYPANSYVKSLPKSRLENWIEDSQSKLPQIIKGASRIVIPTVYLVPNSSNWLATQLSHLKSLEPTGIILMAFGAGNLLHSNTVAMYLDELHSQGHMVVCTTQTPYGGVSESYAAGSWQYNHHVLSAGRLTISAIYARLLWLHLVYESPARRRQRWTYSVNKTQIGIQK